MNVVTVLVYAESQVATDSICWLVRSEILILVFPKDLSWVLTP